MHINIMSDQSLSSDSFAIAPIPIQSPKYTTTKTFSPYVWLSRFSPSGWPYRHVRYKVILLATSLVTPRPCCHWPRICLLVLQEALYPFLCKYKNIVMRRGTSFQWHTNIYYHNTYCPHLYTNNDIHSLKVLSLFTSSSHHNQEKLKTNKKNKNKNVSFTMPDGNGPVSSLSTVRLLYYYHLLGLGLPGI